MKKGLLSVVLLSAALAFSMPAMAEEAQEASAGYTYTSSDGVLSIELPDESWKEVEDPTRWIVLSEGANVITIDHFSNGENLPDMSVADEHYVNVYQAVFSTQNEVFIITGYVVDVDMIPDVAKAIISTKVLKYDTKVAVKKQEQPDATSYSVAALNKTMYVISNGLNIRAESNTDSAIIGGLGYGQAVNVTGSVQQNGQDIGWYQVSYEGKTGYVSASFLSDTQPAAKEEKKTSEEISFTGAAVTIYAQSGTAVSIYKGTDGIWRDKSGTKYTWLNDHMLQSEGGEAFTTYRPASQDSGLKPTGESFTVYRLNGTTEVLTPYSDGSYYSSGWIQYYSSEGGAYAGADGSTLYSNPPAPNAPEGQDNHGLVSQGSGRPVQVANLNGHYVDTAGVEYFPQGDGTFIDSNGDIFNQVW